MQTVLITGGTGLIGKTLTNALLQKGYHVIVLSRKSQPSSGNVTYAQWDIDKKTIDVTAVQKADYIIHLAGAGVVDKKWTTAYKKEIQDSRTKSSELLIDTLKNNTHKIKAVISASAIGWYIPSDILHTEDEKADDSFLGETCRLWEESVEPFKQLNIRVAKLRIGIVLSKDGGALAEFIKPIKFGVAAILGSGKQLISWIHIDDLCRLFIYGIENQNINSIYNAVASEPVTNKTLTLSLAKKLKGRFFIPMHVPEFVLKIMLGGRSVEILKSSRVSNEKILKEGFVFSFDTIDKAIENL
ncbi:TIGR01777 family oxidoreductase [Ferruginibacter sp. SUN002]|uniref:TIGR01777 family oxidoreductase n=1 Tax=Ferruginibacter sp. SUN002 TaxID=2937789 RepID=UPI003D36B29D